MTPEQVCEAFDLIRSSKALREVRTHMVAHPSAWGWIWVGKYDRSENTVDGPSAIIPHDAAIAGIEAAMAHVYARLETLGVRADETKPA